MRSDERPTLVGVGIGIGIGIESSTERNTMTLTLGPNLAPTLTHVPLTGGLAQLVERFVHTATDVREACYQD